MRALCPRARRTPIALLPTSERFIGGAFPLEQGATLPRLELAFKTWGELNAAGDNAVLVCHGYTNNQHAAGEGGWYAGLIGPGKAVDTDSLFVVASNMLGSAYGSTGPASVNPATKRPYGLEFPELTVADMVRAQALLLERLGVTALRAVIGNSYGGYLAWQWGISKPIEVRKLVVVVSALHGRADESALRKLHRRLSACPGWHGGQYYGRERESGVFDEMKRLRVATLREYGFEHQFRVEHENDDERISHRLNELAVRWAEQFDANSLLVLGNTARHFDARPNVRQITAPVLYVLSRTDNLFPPAIAPSILAALEQAGVQARYHEIDSDNGHRAPSLDWPRWSDELRAFVDATR